MIVRPFAGSGMCLIALLSLATMASAQSDSAAEALSKATLFAIGGFGFAGSISQGEKALRTVAASPSATAYFDQILRTGTPEAKAYALLALHQLDRERFGMLAGVYKHSRAPVATGFGCILFSQSLGTIIRAIRGGQYDVFVIERSRPIGPVAR